MTESSFDESSTPSFCKRTLYAVARQLSTECLQHYPEDPTAIHFLRSYAGK